MWQEMKNERRDHGCVHFSVGFESDIFISFFPLLQLMLLLLLVLLLFLRMMRFISSRYNKVADAAAHTAATAHDKFE